MCQVSIFPRPCPNGDLLAFAIWFLLFLLCRGDVEPHPGPRCRKKRNLNICWWNLNTGGAANAWELLQTASEQQVHVITIQESQMHENEFNVFFQTCLETWVHSLHVSRPTNA